MTSGFKKGFNKYMTAKERNAHGILGLVIVLLGLAIVVIFSQYKENIIESGNFQLFILLTAAGLGLLSYLYFLGGKVTAHKSSKKSSNKKR